MLFVQECLRRFGREGDKFILVYRDKTEQERNQAVTDASVVAEEQKTAKGCKNSYSKILLESKNIIFRGAPGTGKSYLAKEIAADTLTNIQIFQMSRRSRSNLFSSTQVMIIQIL